MVDQTLPTLHVDQCFEERHRTRDSRAMDSNAGQTHIYRFINASKSYGDSPTVQGHHAKNKLTKLIWTINQIWLGREIYSWWYYVYM